MHNVAQGFLLRFIGLSAGAGTTAAINVEHMYKNYVLLLFAALCTIMAAGQGRQSVKIAGFEGSYQFPAHATFKVPNMKADSLSASLVLDGNGKVERASFLISDSNTVEYTYGDFTLDIAHISYDASSDALICGGQMLLPESLHEDSTKVYLNFSSLRLNSKGVMALGNTSLSSPIEYDGFYFGLGTKSRIFKDSLVLDGYLVLPHNIGQLHTSLRLEANSKVAVELDSIKGDMLWAHGYEIDVLSAVFEKGVWTINGDFIIPDGFGRIRANAFKVDTSGVIQEPNFDVTNTPLLQMGKYQAKALSATMDDNRLVLKAEFYLWQEKLTMDSLIIYNSGDIQCKRVSTPSSKATISGFAMDSLSFQFGEFVIDSLSNQKYGFSLNGKLNLPNNAGQVKVTDARIYLDGNFDGGHLSDPNVIDLNGFKMSLSGGQFFPSIHYYTLSGALSSHEDTSIAKIIVDGAVAGYVPVIAGKWSISGVRHPMLHPNDIQVINIIDTDNNGEYNPAVDAIFDVSSTATITRESGALGHFKGASNRQNGDLLYLSYSGKQIGLATVWDGHWEHFAHDLPSGISNENVLVSALRKPQGRRISGSGLTNALMVEIEYQGKSFEKIWLQADHTFRSSVLEVHNFDAKKLKVFAFSDTDKDGLIEPNSDERTNITSRVNIIKERSTYYEIVGKSGKDNGSLVEVSKGNTQIGKAMVWDGCWKLDYASNSKVKGSVTAKVFAALKPDSLIEEVKTGIKTQWVEPSTEDFSQWMEFHISATDTSGTANATVLLNGLLELPKFGKVPVEGMNMGAKGLRMPGKKDSHGNPHFRFKGYNYHLNSYDLDLSKPLAVLDGEVVLPDNSGRLWAKVEVGNTGTSIDCIELEDKEVYLGNFLVHADSLHLNRKEEIVISGELDVPNLDRYITLESVTISASTERKQGVVATNDLQLKVHGYPIAIEKAHFAVDTLPTGALVDTLALWGSLDLGAFGNLKVVAMEVDDAGNISKGRLKVGEKGLKVAGFDFSKTADSIRFIHNEIHISKIDYPIPGAEGKIVFGHILIDNEMNFLADQVKLDATVYSYKGYDLTVDQVTWKNDQLLVNGILSLGGDVGNIEIDNIEMLPDGTFKGGTFNLGKSQMNFHGFAFHVKEVGINEQNVLAINGEVVLPNNMGRTLVKNMRVSAEKVLDYGQLDFSQDTISWFGFQVIVDSLQFSQPYFYLGGSFSPAKLGELRLKDLRLDANGSQSEGKILFSNNLEINYNGFNLQVSTIDVETDGLEIDGSIALDDSAGTILVTGLEIDAKGAYKKGHFSYTKGSKDLQFEGLHFELNSLKIADNSIQAHGALELPNGIGRIGAKLNWKKGQSKILDSVSVRDANVTYSGMHMDVESCTYSTSGFTLTGGIDIDNFGTLEVSELKLSTKGVFDGGTVQYKESKWTWGKLNVAVKAAKIENHEILVDGTLTLPNNMGVLELEDVAVDMDGKIRTSTIANGKLTYGGYDFLLDSASLTNDSLVVINGHLPLPNNYGRINITDFNIDKNETVQPGSAVFGDTASIMVGSFGFEVDYVDLTSTALLLDGKLSLPSHVGGVVSFKGLSFTSTGKLKVESFSPNNLSVKANGFDFHLSEVSWDETHQRITLDGTVQLQNSFGSVPLEGLQIGTDGTFYEGKFDLSKLSTEFNGITLEPGSLAFNNGKLEANCDLILPDKTKLSVKGMEISADGIVDLGEIGVGNAKFKWNNYDFELSELTFKDDIFSFSGALDFDKYGSIAVTDIKLSSAGDFYGGSFAPTKAALKYGGMAIQLDSLVFQQSEFEFSGTLSLPEKYGQVVFSDVDLGYGGTFSGGSLVYKGDGFSFKDGAYRVFPTDMYLGSDNFTFDARVVETTTDSVKAIMTGTTIGGSPFTVSFGTETLLNTEFYYKGYDVKVDTFTVAGTKLTYKGSITIPRLGKLEVDGLVMDVSEGKVIDHGTITYTGKTWKLGSTEFTISTVALEEDYIELKAKMVLPNNAGTVDVSDMKLSTTGNLLTASVDVSGVKMGYHGYTIGLSHAQIEGDELELDGTISLNTFGDFNVEDLEFDLKAGTFKRANLTSKNASFSLGSFAAIPQTIVLDNGTLSIDGALKLPKELGSNASVSFSGMEVSSSGSFTIGTITSNNVQVSYKGFDLALTELEWSSGLVLSADLSIPNSSATVALEKLSVSQQGVFSGGALSTKGTAISYHGYSLEIEKAAFLTGSGMSMSGTFTIPGGNASLSVTDLEIGASGISNYGTIAMSSSEAIKWHDFEVSVSSVGIENGTVLVDGSMDIDAVGTLSVEGMGFTTSGNFLPGEIDLTSEKKLTMNGYSLTVSEIKFVDQNISVSGELGLSGNRTISISGLSVDFNGKLSGGTMAYKGDPFSFNGSSVTPYGISFKNGVLSASAQLILPNDIATVTATEVSIDKSFNLKVGAVDVEGVSIHYKGIIVNLDKAEYSDANLSLWGTIENDKLGSLTVSGLVLDNQGSITGGAVDYSGSQTFGKLTVTIDDLGFDWGQGDITLTGSISLPSNIGSLKVDTIVLDPHTGALKSGTLSSTTAIKYGGVGVEEVSATIDNSKIELSGTATLPDEIGSIGLKGLDIGLSSGNVSGGTFTFTENKPITFGGAQVSITSLSFDLTEIDLSAQIQLPSNLGKAGVNDAKFKEGKFSLESVSFSGQSIAIKSVSCEITKGLITSTDVKVSVDVNLSTACKFAIDDFDYSYTNGFSGGTFNLEKAEIKYKDFDLEILSSSTANNQSTFSAQFAIPESSGHAKITGIGLSLENGLDFSDMAIDYGSLPDLLPTGFKMTVDEFEAINNGILFSGSMELLGAEVDVNGLKVTTETIDIDGLEFHTPSFKLGDYSMPNLDFAFSKSGKTWEIDLSGKADVPDVGALDFSGFVRSNGDFGGEFVLKGAMISLGESGFALYNPGGGITDTNDLFTIKLFGDFAPDGMNYVYVLHGELDINSKGVIYGSTEGKLFNMIALQRSYVSIDLLHGKLEYDSEFQFGIQTPPKTTVIKKVDAVTQKIPTIELLGYGGGINVSTFEGFEISGQGNCTLLGIQMGTIDLDIDDKHFEFLADFFVPNPAGGTNLIDCKGNVVITYDEGAGELSGSAAVLGYDLVNMDFKFAPDEISATAAINMEVAQFNIDFLTTKKSNGKFSLDHFHGDAYIGYESMTFADMTLDITSTTWSGSAHAWIPGFGSEIDISVQGDKSKVTYFDGYEAFRVFNIQLEEAEFKYQDQNNKKYISFSADGSLPHFGSSNFDVELQKSGSHWVLMKLDGEVKAYIDINLPIAGHWHEDLGSATIDYDRSKGKLTIDLHSTLFNIGIVRLTDVYGTVYFHEPSCIMGVKGHYGLGKHTYHLWKLHCHYHWCCSGGCSWEKCCYWTVDLGDKYFDLHVTIKGSSLPKPPKEVPMPPKPPLIVESCDVEHLHSGQTCKDTDYKRVTFSEKDLTATQFQGGSFENSTFTSSVLSKTSFENSTFSNLSFVDVNLNQALFSGINKSKSVSISGNSHLNQTKFEKSNIEGLNLSSITADALTINSTTLSKPVWNALNLGNAKFSELTVTGAQITDILFDGAQIEGSTFEGQTLSKTTFNNGSVIKTSDFSDCVFESSVLASVSIDTDSKFNGVTFNQSALSNIDLTGNQNLKNLKVENGSSLTNVDLSRANIGGSYFTGIDLGKVTFDQTKARKVHLTKASLVGTEMKNADFRGSIFNTVQAHKTDISSVDLSHSIFVHSDLSLSTIDKNTNFNHSYFIYTDLHGIDFSDNPHMDTVYIWGTCDLHGTTFQNTSMQHAVFYGVTFHKTDFKGADLSYARFYNCEFDTVNFQEANLTGAMFYRPKFVGHTDFHAAQMRDMDLTSMQTSFNNTNLNGVDFTGTNATGIDFAGSTIDFTNLSGTNLTNANLDGCFSRPQTMLQFDGDKNYVKVPIEENPVLDYQPADVKSYSGNFNNTYLEIRLNEPETEITHEFWFKTSHNNVGLFSTQEYDAKGTSNGHDRHIYLNGGNIYARVWNNEIIHSSGANYADNKWHHVAHVIGHSIKGQKIYVDGKQVASGARSFSDFNWQDRVFVGYSQDAGNDAFIGQIDEVRIWNQALSESTIKAWMNKGPNVTHPNYHNLLVYLPFDEGSGSVVVNKAIPGLTANWQKMAKAESHTNLTPGHYDYGPSLEFDEEITLETWAISASTVWNDDATLICKRPDFFMHPAKATKNIYFWYDNAQKKNHNVGAMTPGDIHSNYHHYVITMGGGKAKYYIDGALVKTVSVAKGDAFLNSHVRLNLGQDDFRLRQALDGNMLRTRIWDKALSQDEIKASMTKPVITHYDANFAHLRLQVKDLSIDKQNYTFNGYFSKNQALTNGSWSNDNAPITYPAASKAQTFTVEINAMPTSNNDDDQVLFQHGRKYGTSGIFAAAGYQIKRNADQKISFEMYRQLRATESYALIDQSKSPTSHCVEPMGLYVSATWDFELGVDEEQGLSFHVTPGAVHTLVELFVDGESKGRKQINSKAFYANDYVSVFPFADNSLASMSNYVGAGTSTVLNPTDQDWVNHMYDPQQLYKGYLYDLRLWKATVKGSVLGTWHRLDISPQHPNFDDLIVNYTMADGATAIQNHGYHTSETVHYGDFIRLKHHETSWELTSYKTPAELIGHKAGSVHSINETNALTYWQVLPKDLSKIKSMEGKAVSLSDGIVLRNAFTHDYLAENTTSNKKVGNDLEPVLGATAGSGHIWTIDSLYNVSNEVNVEQTTVKWGDNLVLKSSSSRYLSSSPNTSSKVGSIEFQATGTAGKIGFSEIWTVDEVITTFDYNSMFSSSGSMPQYITLPNFDQATLKNTTMPDGTVIK